MNKSIAEGIRDCLEVAHKELKSMVQRRTELDRELIEDLHKGQGITQHTRELMDEWSKLSDAIFAKAKEERYTRLTVKFFGNNDKKKQVMEAITRIGGLCLPRSSGSTLETEDEIHILIPSMAIRRMTKIERSWGPDSYWNETMIRLKTEDRLVYSEHFGERGQIFITPTGDHISYIEERINAIRTSTEPLQKKVEAINEELARLLAVISTRNTGIVIREFPEREPIFIVELHRMETMLTFERCYHGHASTGSRQSDIDVNTFRTRLEEEHVAEAIAESQQQIAVEVIDSVERVESLSS